MKATNFCSYEEAIEILNSDPSFKDLIKVSYLDSNPHDAWSRFEKSEEFEEIARLLGLRERKGLRILDLGAGNGIATRAFINLGHNTVSVDPNSGSRVGLGALSKTSASQGCVASFAEVLPFKDSSFDVVYSRQTLHHLSDLKEGLKEISRVLVDGGTFLASRDHVISNEAEREEFLRSHPLQKLHGGEWAYTLNEYRDAILSSGLKIVQEIRPFDSVINHFPVSNAEIATWLQGGLAKKVGTSLALLLSKSLLVEKWYRRKLSREISTPGRLYSWLCKKAAR